MSERAAHKTRIGRGLWPLLAISGALLIASLSCSVGEILVGRSAPTQDLRTRTPRPTFTALPDVATASPVTDSGVHGVLPPGVTAIVPSAPGDETPLVSSTSVLIFATPTTPPRPKTPTRAPSPTASPTLAPTLPPTATPFAVINSATANGRRGPGTGYEIVGQAKQGQPYMILGRTPKSDWWQVCCIANQPAWVSGELATTQGSVEFVPVMTAGPTPTVTTAPSPTRTLTPSPTPRPPFDIAQGPIFPIQVDTGMLTIWVQVYEGPTDNKKALAGYVLKVFQNGSDVSSSKQSQAPVSGFDYMLPDDGLMPYNLKYELPGAGEAAWEIYLARPDGSRVSPITKFTTLGDAYRNLVVYIAYWLAR